MELSGNWPQTHCSAVMPQLHTKEQIMIEKHDEAQNGFLAPGWPRLKMRAALAAQQSLLN